MKTFYFGDNEPNEGKDGINVKWFFLRELSVCFVLLLMRRNFRENCLVLKKKK